MVYGQVSHADDPDDGCNGQPRCSYDSLRALKPWKQAASPAQKRKRIAPVEKRRKEEHRPKRMPFGCLSPLTVSGAYERPRQSACRARQSCQMIEQAGRRQIENASGVVWRWQQECAGNHHRSQYKDVSRSASFPTLYIYGLRLRHNLIIRRLARDFLTVARSFCAKSLVNFVCRVTQY